MEHAKQVIHAELRPLASAWLVLVVLTLLSPLIGHWFNGGAWLQVLVAAIVWIKGRIVAKRFIETDSAHPFIRNVLAGFIAFTPLALVGTAAYRSLVS